MAALASAFPEPYDDRLWMCLAVRVLITGVNLRGIVESARAVIVPTAFFGVSILGSSPSVSSGPPVSTAAAAVQASALVDKVITVGALLPLKAFASGCSALTGVEALADTVPSFRVPRVRRAQRAEVGLGLTGVGHGVFTRMEGWFCRWMRRP